MSPTILPATMVSAREFSTEAVESVHIPAGRFTGGIEPLQSVGGPVLVGPDPAHAIVLAGTHGNHLRHGIDPEELGADLVHFPEFRLDMLFTQMANIQPQVIAVRALDALALADVVGSSSAKRRRGKPVPACPVHRCA